MTTIAFRDGVMAADSRAIRNGIIHDAEKLFEHSGKIMGVTGNLSDALIFINWVREGSNMDALPEYRRYGNEDGPDFEVLMMEGGRMTIWTEYMQPCPVEAPFFAVGTGSQFAMGAMAAGASAENAVHTAARFDSSTGGEVQIVRAGA